MLRALVVLGALAFARTSSADVGALTSDSFPYHEGHGLDLDAGLLLGFPTALPTGLSRGIGGGFATDRIEPLHLGLRAAWVTATESSVGWKVTHSDLRLRVAGSLQHEAGRGSIGLRFGLGGTLVHETRDRNQGQRAGAMGDALQTSVFAMVPAGEFEAVVAVHVVGSWQLVMSGGPSWAIVDHDVHGSWIAELGVGWQP
jgi:hypothetical protein